MMMAAASAVTHLTHKGSAAAANHLGFRQLCGCKSLRIRAALWLQIT